MGEQALDVTAIADFVKTHLQPTTLEIDVEGRTEKVLVAAEGTEVTSLRDLAAEYRSAPERIKGTSEHTTLESFIDHAVRFQDKESALFAHRDAQKPSLLAVYDYHPTVDDKTGVAAKVARFGQHRARYTFPVADEWAAWTRSQGPGNAMTQAAFAEFLEGRIADVADPLGALETTKAIMEKLLVGFASPAALMDLSRGLTVRVNSMIANAQNLKSGETQVRYETTHTDEGGAPLSVPGAFLISIPVFRGGDAYQLAARLRYRLKDAKMTWFYDLYRSQETFEHAFEQACVKARDDAKLPLFFGQPEGT